MQTVSPEEARDLLAKSSLDIVDVRDAGEWLLGHLPGARHVPLAELRQKPREYLAKDGVLFVCAAGIRSQAAARLADELGLTEVYSMNGGTRGWARAGLPLVKSSAAA